MNAVPRALHDQWVTTSEAAEELGVNVHYLYQRNVALREACEHRASGDDRGASEMRGRGVVYLAHDIRRLAKIIGIGLTLETSCKVLSAIDKGLIP